MMPRDLLEAAPTDTPAQPRDLLAPAQDLAGKVAGDTKLLVPQAQRELEARTARFKQQLNTARGRSPDVDYEGGLSFMDQSFLSAMDNPAEKRAYLEQKYGKANIGQDPGGSFYVVQNGKKISAEGGGTLEGIGANIAGNIGPIGGATVGAIGGGALAGPPGAIAGAGLGAAVGKGGQEALKYGAGYLRKTPKEEAETIGTELGLGMVGEGAGKVVTGAAGRLSKGPLPTMLGGQTPESNAMSRMTLDKGGVPPLVSAIPSSRYLQRHMELAERLVGPAKEQEKRNFELVRNEVRAMLRKSGLSDSQADAALAQVMDPTSKLSTTDLGREIKTSVAAHKASLESAAQSQMSEAGTQLDAQLKHLDTLTRRYKPGDLGVDVASGITQSRSDFSTAASKVYERVDRLVGDAAIVPTNAVKKEAKSIVDSLPKSATGDVVLPNAQLAKALSDLQSLPDKISFGDAQKIRSILGDLSEMKDLVPPTSKRQFDNLRQSVNVAFNIATADPKAAAGLNMLKAADKFYSDGIKKFNDLAINRIVRQAENGLPVDPSEVAKLVLESGSTARVETLKKILPPDVWKRVAGADFDSMVSKSTRLESGAEVVNGKMLLRQIERRGNLLTIAYGPNTANQIRQYAFRLAAKDGELPAANLNMDNFSATMMRHEAVQNEIDNFMKRNYLSELAKPTQSPDAAFNWIVRPGHESELEQAISHFGENSPIVQGVRLAAVKDVLGRATVETATGTETTIQGPAIEKALSSYTRRQQDLLFPGGLADDMRTLAKEVKFLFPENVSTRTMGGFTAGAILNAPAVIRWPLQAYHGMWQWLLTRPNVVKALALGLKGDGTTRAVTRESVRAMFRAAVLGNAPQEGEAQ